MPQEGKMEQKNNQAVTAFPSLCRIKTPIWWLKFCLTRTPSYYMSMNVSIINILFVVHPREQYATAFGPKIFWQFFHSPITGLFYIFPILQGAGACDHFAPPFGFCRIPFIPDLDFRSPLPGWAICSALLVDTVHWAVVSDAAFCGQHCQGECLYILIDDILFNIRKEVRIQIFQCSN